MAKLLIAYSTTDGHTLKICERIKYVIEQQSHEVDVRLIGDDSSIDVEPFDKIVVGASIRYGKHQPMVHEFIKEHQATLESTRSAFFSVNVVARKPEKNQPATNPYMQKFLKQISWQPQLMAVFAGKINYPIYKFWDRQAIRFIMWMTKGPTDLQAVVEFTDWNKVEDFARLVAEDLR
jgi:menaquinone-dependent protoporphyrinogen oxidase